MRASRRKQDACRFVPQTALTLTLSQRERERHALNDRILDQLSRPGPLRQADGPADDPVAKAIRQHAKGLEWQRTPQPRK